MSNSNIILNKTIFIILVLLCLGYVGCQNVSRLAGECLNKTTCPCCSTSCPSDGSGQCDGNCKDGYHGGKCWNYCPVNCIRCVDSLLFGGVANCTLCKDGYYSTPSRYQCQSPCSSNCKTCGSDAVNCDSCHTDFYLTNAKTCIKCKPPCKTCISENNCTSCAFGYFLNHSVLQCQKCNPLCLYCNSSDNCECSNGCAGASFQSNVCNGNQCLFGCKPNFMSSVSQHYTCDKCVGGYYGYECNLPCNSNCDANICQRLTGHCFACKTGFYGNMCEKACPQLCKTSCEKTLGVCDSCQRVYYGFNCELQCQNSCKACTMSTGSCNTCVDGFYGDECEKTCSLNCQERNCKRTDGSCTCVSGYMGPTCTIVIANNSANEQSRVFPRETPSTTHTEVGKIIGISLAAVVVIASIVGVGLWWHRKRKFASISGTRLLPSTNADRSHLEKLEKEMSNIEIQLNMLMVRKLEIVPELERLKISSQSKDQAGTADDKSYEMLKRPNNESQYSTLE